METCQGRIAEYYEPHNLDNLQLVVVNPTGTVSVGLCDDIIFKLNLLMAGQQMLQP